MRERAPEVAVGILEREGLRLSSSPIMESQWPRLSRTSRFSLSLRAGLSDQLSARTQAHDVSLRYARRLVDTASMVTKTQDRRRSQRVLLKMSVEVSGSREGRSFSENAFTAIVSAHGALLLLQQTVAPKQHLVVTNTLSREGAACRVVEVHGRNAETGATEISVEFESPSPRFWHIAFPPEDWTPKSPEAKRFEAQGLRTHSV